MMDYLKRRFSTGESQNQSMDHTMASAGISRQSAPEAILIPDVDVSNPIKGVVNQQTGTRLLSQSISKEKSKLLFVIDDQHTDWSKYFKNKQIFADYTIHVEQAEFKDIHLSAYSDGGVLIKIDTHRHGRHILRSFRPDFVLVRQYVKDVNVDWINIILGMQYGAVPSVNSMRALYNFRDKPWIYAELLKIQQRLDAEQFPLISQVYYPNHRKLFVSPQFPSVIKIGQAHQGLGKIKIDNLCDYHDVTSIIAISECYSTIEPYIHGACDVYIQKIGHNYRAFSRKSISGNWKANLGSVVFEQIEMTDRYRLWIDEVSQIFGGLDICAIELVQSKTGKEFIIEINDCTMQLLGETQEEDCQAIAELIRHKMQIYCRPNQELTILTRIPSFDDLPKLPQSTRLSICPNGNVQQISNNIHTEEETEDTFGHLKKTFTSIFGDMYIDKYSSSY